MNRRTFIAALAPRRGLRQTDLFNAGGAGVHTYRIPALIETKRRVLIAVCDARHDNARDLPGNISLVMRRSFNNGRTWSEIQTIRAAVPDGAGVGDPSLLLDSKSNRVWCFHIFAGKGAGFNTALSKEMQCHAVYSDDDGVHWSTPTDLTSQLKQPGWQAIFATSGTHFQTRTGRFLLPMVVRDDNGVISSRNAYSDDRGRTWNIGSAIGPRTDESKAVELRDGTILQNMRYTKHRAIARSHDGGITFDPVQIDENLPDPVCNAGIFRCGKTLVFTNAASTEKRERMTIRISHDEGKSWPLSRVIHDGPAAYSTAIRLSDGSIGMLYERGDRQPYERITFARFPPSWIGSVELHPR